MEFSNIYCSWYSNPSTYINTLQ